MRMRTQLLEIGASVPGIVLRLLAIAVAGSAALLMGAQIPWTATVTALALAGAVAPILGGTWFAAGALVLLLIAQPQHPMHTAVVVAAVHLMHVLGSLSLVVPLRARIALRALRPTAIRFALMQAAGQAAALSASMLPRGGAVPLAVVAGGAATLALAVMGSRALRARRQFAYPAGGRASGAVRR